MLGSSSTTRIRVELASELGASPPMTCTVALQPGSCLRVCSGLWPAPRRSRSGRGAGERAPVRRNLEGVDRVARREDRARDVPDRDATRGDALLGAPVRVAVEGEV